MLSSPSKQHNASIMIKSQAGSFVGSIKNQSLHQRSESVVKLPSIQGSHFTVDQEAGKVREKAGTVAPEQHA